MKCETMFTLIRTLQQRDIQHIAASFEAIGWNKPAMMYQQYFCEQEAGQRTVLLAFNEKTFSGYITINWQSDYPPFQAANIPEIQDFNVLPQFRRRGIGTHLMEQAEQRIARRSTIAGIGVGMYADYGAAQRLYVLRGYVPDGRGLLSMGQTVTPGTQITVDDALVLYMTKRLTQ
jgi:GNAT superfamily N-acetyltransferase